MLLFGLYVYYRMMHDAYNVKKVHEKLQASRHAKDYFVKTSLETLRLVPSDMINNTANAGKWYPRSRDHFKKAVANHVHTLGA